MHPQSAKLARRKVPELVSPAGSLAAFQAGMDAGADAFYVGIGTLNARARAQNFTLDELEDLVCAVRDGGRRIYLALNVLVGEDRLRECIAILERAEGCGVDAVIVQDLGVLHLLRRYFPGLRVHASTQMFLHNTTLIEALSRRGVSRVILPRELTLDEIRTIRARTGVEFEIFIHGALCFSFSGLCLASSYLFGESGNRGACKQVCRFAFEGGTLERPFAMKDLDGSAHLDALLETGVEALKIEGRLRNTDYIREVVGFYRGCLDEYAAGRPVPRAPRWRFNRRTTPGGFAPLSYEDMICGDGESWIGEPVGKVESLYRGRAVVLFDRPVFRGDRIRILREDGVKVHEFTLLDRRGARCEVEVEPGGGRFSGWKVFRLGTSQAPSMRRLRKGRGSAKTWSVTIGISYDGREMGIEAHVGDVPRFHAAYPVGASPGMRPLEPGRIEACFRRVDKAPFNVEAVSVSLDSPLCLPIRDLNAIRREFFASLEALQDEERDKRNRSRREAIDLELGETGPASAQPEEGEGTPFEGRGIDPSSLAASAIPLPGRAMKILPWDEFIGTRACGEADGSLAGASVPGPVAWVELPLFVSEGAVEGFLGRLEGLIEDDGIGFVCSGLGWVDHLRGRVPAERIASGGFLYCLNRFAYRLLRDAGASRVALSSDFPVEDVGELIGLEGVVIPRERFPRFFVTRHRPPAAEYRFRRRTLRVVWRGEYGEVVLPWGT